MWIQWWLCDPSDETAGVKKRQVRPSGGRTCDTFLGRQLWCRLRGDRGGTLVPMPSLSPVLLSDARILAAYIIFIGSYVVFALGKFPWMKIDRPGAAIIGAVLMVAFRIVGSRDALASIDFATIVLLFSMMLIVASLRLAGFFDWITEWIIQRLHPHHLLPTVIFTSGRPSRRSW
ncbi:MAG TPA: SLC13 family permease [Vicinamibacterales bacterium]|nr:SLC13 family permease [Vicinamibacterales bacterium]